MNKKEEQWRMEGALYALRLAKEKGIAYLQEDIKRRGALGMSLLIPEKAAEETYDILARKVMSTVKTVAMWTLYEQNGWKRTRLKRFEQQMDANSALCMDYDRFGKNYVKLSDMAKEMQMHCGTNPDLETLEQVERENKEARGQFVSLDAIEEIMREYGFPEIAVALRKKVEENEKG